MSTAQIFASILVVLILVRLEWLLTHSGNGHAPVSSES
jgi:hypothetical protein